MALNGEEGGGIGATMLVSPTGGMGYPYPVYQGGGGNSGNGGWSDGWWIILLFILLASGNWGGNGNGNGGGMFGAPYIVDNNGGAVQRGFDQAAVMNGVNGIQSGLYDLSTQICNGFANTNATINNGFFNAETAAQARAIAQMQNDFAAQMQNAQGFNNLGARFDNCCCENRLATADLKYTIATENCADRAALSEGVRDILENCNRNNQRILDQLCADKIDAKNEKIADLERQLTMANLAASQIAQTAQIVDQTYNRFSTCPVGTVPVYGEQPIFRCDNNNGCGCGNGTF